MAEPVTSYISSAWLKPLWKQLKAIRGERGKEIQRITGEFQDPYELARYYIEPNCQHHNPADYLEDEEPRSFVKCPVFKTINDFLEGEFAVTEGGRNQMFILSDAGMGKTSLLVMLKLSHLTRFWPPEHHCGLLKLGPDTLDQVKRISAPGDTVLLLDALDEDRSAWGKIQERLLDLLTQTAHFHRVIISCRTQFFPDTAADPFGNPGRVKMGGFICPMIFLSLFDDGQVEDYLEKRYPNQWFHWFQANSKKEMARQLVSKMKDLRCRPMLLAHIEDLVKSTITDWSEYSVYQVLIQAWLDREGRKLRRQGRQDIDSQSLFTGCLLVAGQMQHEGVRFLSERDLKGLIQAHPEVGHLTQIELEGRSLLNRNANGDYRFSHFSVQEYLVAQGLLRESKDKIEAPRNASEKVIKFLIHGRAVASPRKKLILRGLNLARFDLVGAQLEDTDLSDADLSHAKLDGANLKNAILDRAKLEGISTTQPVAGIPFFLKINDVVKMEFVWIPPGSFLMGDSDERQVKVKLSRGFWIGKYPVTQRQYETLSGKNPSHFQSEADAPVEQVNWEKATAFCQKIIEHQSPADYLSSFEYRLPTEAEWEYACRAGTTTRFGFGDNESVMKDYAWFSDNSGNRTHPVGEKKPNNWGLYDMHGNVWEWCQDWYGEYPKGAVTDPKGPDKGEIRVLRGGCWCSAGEGCRSAFRLWRHPSDRYDDFGFRVVLAPRSGASGE